MGRLKAFILLGWLILGILAPNAHSQLYVIKKFNRENGLPSSVIYDIQQDVDGNIWFATNMGVCKFDGLEYEYFDAASGLPNNEILKVFPDSEGKVWFGSAVGGLSFYEDGKIFNEENTGFLKDQGIYVPVFPLLEGQDGRIWFSAFGRGLLKYHNDSLYRYFKKDEEDFFGIITAWEDRGGVLRCYIPSNYGNSSLNQLETFDFNQNDPSKVNHNDIFKIFKDSTFWVSEGFFLISTPDSFFLSKDPQKSFKKIRQHKIFDIPGSQMTSICSTNDFYLIGSRSKLIVLSKKEQYPTYPEEFQNRFISSIFEDREKNIWVSTLGGGAFLLIKPKIWRIRNTTSGQFLSFSFGKKSNFFAWGSNDNIHIRNGKIVEEQNKFWGFHKVKRSGKSSYIGLEDKNIYKIGLDGKPKKYIHPDKGAIKDFLQSKNGLEYLSTHKGFFKREKGKDWEALINQSFWNSNLRIYHIFEAKDSKIYLGTNRGPAVFQSDSIKFFKFQGEEIQSSVNGIAASHNGVIFFASNETGVIYKLPDGGVGKITTNHGLSSNICRSVVVDKNQNLWIGTPFGITKISFENGIDDPTILRIDRNDGLVSNEVEVLEEHNDSIYVGGSGGISILPLDFVPDPIPSAPIQISNVSVGYKKAPVKNHYELNFNERDLKIKFVTIAIREAREVVYEYQMEGLDPDWITTNQRMIQYPSLPPGNYRFKVRSHTPRGGYSPMVASMTIRVLPPWYQTTWFLSLVGVFFLGSLIAGVRMRINAVRRRNEMELRLSSLKTQALGLQMNPHFIFNSLNSIYTFINRNDKLGARKYLTKFGKLVRGILENSTSDFITLNREIDVLNAYLNLETLRMDGKMSYEINVEDSLEVDFLEIPAMVIQPYVENAIWHGINHKDEPGTVKVNFSLDEPVIICAIVDDGKGRAYSQEIQKGKVHRSISTSSIRERLEILNRNNDLKTSVEYVDLEDSDGKPCGTKVNLYIPIRNL